MQKLTWALIRCSVLEERETISDLTLTKIKAVFKTLDGKFPCFYMNRFDSICWIIFKFCPEDIFKLFSD